MAGAPLKTARDMEAGGELRAVAGVGGLVNWASWAGAEAMQKVFKLIGQLASSAATALITGESGTGKELVARAVYHHSKRSEQAFLAINCAAIPENLLESELFGHERGAFTGAAMQRIGRFEQCHEGTIFLDEIGDMTLSDADEDFARVLQSGTFERVGGNEPIKGRCAGDCGDEQAVGTRGGGAGNFARICFTG